MTRDEFTSSIILLGFIADAKNSYHYYSNVSNGVDRYFNIHPTKNGVVTFCTTVWHNPKLKCKKYYSYGHAFKRIENIIEKGIKNI